MPRSKFEHDVHRYVRFEQTGPKGKRILWRCVLPNCRHYLVGDMVIGQMTKCNRCAFEEFQMRRAHLSFKKPHCLRCTRGYKGGALHEDIPIQTIMDNLDELLKG